MDSTWSLRNSIKAQRLLIPVDSVDEIRENLETFHVEARYNAERVASFLRTPKLNWVYNPDTDKFATSKFAAFKDMSYHLYDYGLNPACKEPFSGTTATNRIRSLTGKEFQPDAKLVKKVANWALTVSPGLGENIRSSGWRFLSL